MIRAIGTWSASVAFQALPSYLVSWNSQILLEVANFAVDDLAMFLESSADFEVGGGRGGGYHASGGGGRPETVL